MRADAALQSPSNPLFRILNPSKPLLNPFQTQTRQVQANPELRGIVARGADGLPAAVIESAFRGLYGRTLNYAHFAGAVRALDRWYREKGLLGQVVDFGFAVREALGGWRRGGG